MEINMKKYDLDCFKKKDLYTWDEILDVIEDLIYENKNLKEELKDLEEDVASNYRPLTVAEQVE